jgi:hypothetical protein
MSPTSEGEKFLERGKEGRKERGREREVNLLCLRRHSSSDLNG